MAAFNLSSSDPFTFILMGIPGLEDDHNWISIPYCLFYTVGLLANSMVLFLVGKERTLHKPMYILLCMLGLTDIISSSLVVPKALCIFWFNWKDIIFSECLNQMFFLNVCLVMHSSVLVMMAFDRYVAICNPLRYTTILTNARVAKLGLVGLIKAVLYILPMPLFLSRLSFCASRMIPQTYCESIALAKVSCGDITVIRVYGLVILIVIMGLDESLIALSYGLIIRAVLRVSSKKGHLKALNTCTAHFCVILLYCIPSLFSVVTQRFGYGIAPHVHTIFANLYLLLPPMLNPIIYGVLTKELREKVGKYTCRVRSPRVTDYKST